MINFIKKLLGLSVEESGGAGKGVTGGKSSPGQGGIGDLEKFVAFVAQSLVDHPEEIRVETEAGEERATIKIFCNKTDNGKIIGKRGKTISAIRSLVSGAAGRLQQKVNVEVVD